MLKVVVREHDNNASMPTLHKPEQGTLQNPGVTSNIQTVRPVTSRKGQFDSVSSLQQQNPEHALQRTQLMLYPANRRN
jgi:hypothetical protein